MNANQKLTADHIIETLNSIEADGETLEYIIRNTAQEYQVLKQLLMKASEFDINNLLEERNENK